mgnify:CR=1 FL=1
MCTVNLQGLKEILKDIWAFSIALDAGNNAGTAYLDLRMRCYYKNFLQNLHLLAIPMRERHTGAYQYDLIVNALDILAPNWRYQLIGVSSDGASTMTGCIQGTVSRLARECHTPIFRIWCGAHQLDLVIKKAFNGLCNERFLNIVTGVTGHLRRQQNLISDMKCACPTFVLTRWISMGKLLKWLKEKRIRLLQHFEEKTACSPSTEWWITIMIIQPLVKRIEKTFISLQGLNTLVCEQRKQLSQLGTDIMSRCNIKGPISVEEELEFKAQLQQKPLHGFILGRYCVSQKEIVDAINEVGGFVQLSMDQFCDSDDNADRAKHQEIVSSFANFGLQIVTGVMKIVVERDARNSGTEEIPPVLPLDLFNVNSRLFTASLQQQRIRLRQKLSDEAIEQIDEQFRQLRIAVREETGLKAVLEQAHTRENVQSFDECWSPLGTKYSDLHRFCAGMASVMPGTSSVEADFSLISWTKDPNSQRMTDFSLESILHCKQYDRLQKLLFND